MTAKSLRLAIIAVATAVLLAFAMAAAAGEIYIWIDKQGNRHITDQPPAAGGRLIETDSFRDASPDEMRRHEAENRRATILQDAEDRQDELRRKRRAEQESAAEAYRERRDRAAEKSRDAERERDRARIEDLEARKDYLRAIDNRDYREARRLRIKDQERRIDRRIKEAREGD